MITFVKNLMSKNKGCDATEHRLSAEGYTLYKDLMHSPHKKDRMKLAQAPDTPKEILYYLAEKDPEPDVREAVAHNRSMPVHASRVLAQDHSQDVRLALAARLVDLLPDLSEDKHSQLYAYAVQALGTLALDEVLKVRVALSSTLKDHAHAPPKVAAQLAGDVEREVSEPILRFCTALSDEDLLNILRSHPDNWVIETVASRPKVSGRISRAVIETNSRLGGKALISNDGAELLDDTLQQIVIKAKDYPEWHKPMATRASLPASIAKEMASFVDASVRDLLMQREDMDQTTIEEISAVFRRRMDFAADESEDLESVEDRINRIENDGKLSEDVIADALGMRDRSFVNTAIARIIKVDVSVVVKIFDMKAAKPVVALAWHAGLSMRMALKLQKDMAHVPPKELIYPRDGTDYPFSIEELDWQLEFLGLK